jgi:hypothetical protein
LTDALLDDFLRGHQTKMKPYAIATKNGWRLEQTSSGDVIVSRRLPGQCVTNSIHYHSQTSKSAVDHQLLSLNRKTLADRVFHICFEAILKLVKPRTGLVSVERSKREQRLI